MGKVPLACLLLLCLAVPAVAQTTGSITGTVTDDSGAVLPGVRVTASSPGAHGRAGGADQRPGVYRFPSLPPGTYAMKFELPGFATLNREGIIVNIGFTATVPVKLKLARGPRR